MDKDLTNKVGYARRALSGVYGFIVGYVSRHKIDVERSALETVLRNASKEEVR